MQVLSNSCCGKGSAVELPCRRWEHEATGHRSAGRKQRAGATHAEARKDESTESVTMSSMLYDITRCLHCLRLPWPAPFTRRVHLPPLPTYVCVLYPGTVPSPQSVAGGVACSLFRGTGRHFLALDGGSGELPLLLRLAMDHEGHQGAAGAQGGVPPEVQAQEGPKCGGNCCGAAGGGGGGGDSSGGQYFFSALRAFRSRACYGNVGRDHW